MAEPGYPLKRALDVAGAGLVLAVSGPALLAIAAAVWATMGRPVHFRQERTGLHGRRFVLYKFRTMRDAWNPAGEPLPDQARLTRLGRLLRTTSLDELPSLWNVLRGEMSLVGPRPLLPEYLPLYSEEQATRHRVKPGITGWAQVNGRNTLDWERRFELDGWYVEHLSLRLDLRILLRTVGSVARREGITQEGHASMERFRGSAR